MFETLRNALKVKDIRKKTPIYISSFNYLPIGQSASNTGN